MAQAPGIIRLQTETEIIRTYQNHLQYDFPPAERKPLSSILQANRAGTYRAFGVYENEQCLAYAYFVLVPESDWLLLDYYAVRSDLRGSGIGSWFLAQIQTLEADHPTVLLEIEDAESAETEEDHKHCLRRERFYRRAGAQFSNVLATTFGVPYRLLTFSNAPVSDAEVARQYEAIYLRMLGVRYESVVSIKFQETKGQPD